jgi:hypothetical protein
MIDIFESQPIICRLHGDSALPTCESTYYNFPADSSTSFTFTIATTGFMWVGDSLPAHGSMQLPKKKGRKWLQVDRQRTCWWIHVGRDNLSQDPQTIDLTPVSACMHTEPDSGRLRYRLT